MDTPDAQEIALNNPIILTEILKQTSVQLRDARLVSKFWNDIVLSLPNTRLTFCLNDVDDEYAEDEEYTDEDLHTHRLHFFEICSTLNKRLSKRISAEFDTSMKYGTEEPAAPAIYSFGAKLTHVSALFSDTIQTLEISICIVNFLKYVYQALKNSCPNLTQLQISCEEVESLNTPFQLGTITAKPRLTIFSLDYAVDGDRTCISGLTSLVQEIINASPNLKEVTFPWGCHPDLAHSKCLDSLRIALSELSEEKDIVPFNGSELWRMLNQVGDQLVSLFFGENNEIQDISGLGRWKRIEFGLPKIMPKLKMYRNLFVDVFECTDILKNIEKMPVLNTLVLGKTTATKSTSLHDMLQTIFNSGKILGNVRNLKIIEMHDPTLLEHSPNTSKTVKTKNSASLAVYLIPVAPWPDDLQRPSLTRWRKPHVETRNHS
ncbi:hypothetical protein Fcan01_16884 [Folsomia candida]|uniref:F-box domain-containing protein n=1 Tax=Folsomia candida TaxID=158441 RepID=A0A226DSG8_FOLCA|nr:hypothetical protein Fcan01_16884 [Folsomia candida]